jgi:hypothetical protein
MRKGTILRPRKSLPLLHWRIAGNWPPILESTNSPSKPEVLKRSLTRDQRPVSRKTSNPLGNPRLSMMPLHPIPVLWSQQTLLKSRMLANRDRLTQAQRVFYAGRPSSVHSQQDLTDPLHHYDRLCPQTLLEAILRIHHITPLQRPASFPA